MTTLEALIPQVSTGVALAIIFAMCMKQALAFHVQSLKEQREDLLNHMKTQCNATQKIKDLLPPLLILSLLLLPGCQQGQGGSLAKFAITTPIGNLSIDTWTVTPAGTPPTTRPVD